MKICRSISEIKQFRQSLEENGVKNVGFVPTMGALHEGHLSLINQAVSQNEAMVVSIFVNPTQFLPNEDLAAYPRKEAADLAMCETAGVAAVFLPQAEEIYSDDEPKILASKRLSSLFEGASRAGHFDGVCAVLTKLFSLIRPSKAYFGKKDAQQVAVVQNLVARLFLPLEIVPCELVRAKDGLALSSRNAYLSSEEREVALSLSRALKEAAQLVARGVTDAQSLNEKMSQILAAAGAQKDYTAVVDREFNELSHAKLHETILLIAARVGKTRLIDNLWI